eukprot:5468106-Pleurochrysis_carterae.AAC.1
MAAIFALRASHTTPSLFGANSRVLKCAHRVRRRVVAPAPQPLFQSLVRATMLAARVCERQKQQPAQRRRHGLQCHGLEQGRFNLVCTTAVNRIRCIVRKIGCRSLEPVRMRTECGDAAGLGHARAYDHPPIDQRAAQP